MKNSIKTFAISIIILLATIINVNAQENLLAYNASPIQTEQNYMANEEQNEEVKVANSESKVEANEIQNISNYSLMKSVPTNFKGSSAMIQQNQPKVNNQSLGFGNGNMNQNISKSDYGVGVKLRLK